MIFIFLKRLSTSLAILYAIYCDYKLLEDENYLYIKEEKKRKGGKKKKIEVVPMFCLHYDINDASSFISYQAISLPIEDLGQYSIVGIICMLY